MTVNDLETIAMAQSIANEFMGIADNVVEVRRADEPLTAVIVFANQKERKVVGKLAVDLLRTMRQW